MWDNDRGQIIVPTGGGKTICMIDDAKTMMEMGIQHGKTFVVVAPRILLAEQLCSEFLELIDTTHTHICLLYTSPSPRDRQKSRMPSSA